MEAANDCQRALNGSKEVVDSRLSNKTNEAEGDHLIQPMMVNFEELIDSASKLFAEYQK